MKVTPEPEPEPEPQQQQQQQPSEPEQPAPELEQLQPAEQGPGAEEPALTWELYCGAGRGCDCGRCCAQLKKDYREHNRVSILCHGVQYGVWCVVFGAIIGFIVWLASSVW